MAIDPPAWRPRTAERHLRAVDRSSRWSSSISGARIEVEVTGGDAVVAISGDVDLANIAALRDALRNVRCLGATRIVVDASELDFLAVAAARELAAAPDVAVVDA